MTSLGALRVRGYRVWFGASFCMGFALQMIELIIGWSVYSRHQSALGRRGCVTIAIVWMRLFPGARRRRSDERAPADRSECALDGC